MDSGFILKLENPKKSANIFSKLFFLWMIKFCQKGTKKTLEIIDLYKPLSYDQSDKLANDLENHWTEEISKARQLDNRIPSLTRAIVKTFIWKYMFYGLLIFFYLMVFRSFQPLVLAYFINSFSGTIEDNQNEKYIYASILVLQSFFVIMFMYHIDYGQSLIGMRIRVAVSSLIYRKLLKLDKKSLGKTAAGQVVNLLSNDVQRFDMVTMALHYFWVVPFILVLVSYLIWIEVGISSLAGILSVLSTFPMQIYLFKLTSNLRLKTAKKTDNRVKLMTEIISGIQVIKMYAWEKPFEKIVKLARKSEIDVITRSSYLKGFLTSSMVLMERATLFFTITCYVLLGNPITADKVFSLAQFINILQASVAITYPLVISMAAEASISIKRLQDFLLLEEKLPSTIEKSAENAIVLRDVGASWTPPTFTIKNFDLIIPHGSFCAIIGPVGAGKSSTLQLLLGELIPVEGSIKVGGSISYAAQEPWLFSATVRNNILFGQEYNQILYKKIVRICALEKDFQQFPQSDKTLVGERGVSLSGGQRARINLARAIYRQADIYLLDDPLSAVDTHVGRHLFEECILGYLKNKTRILVTHQLQYLKKADLIVVLNNGKIEAQGTFEELTHINLDFTNLLIAADETTEEEERSRNPVERSDSLKSDKSTKSEFDDSTKDENTEEMGSSKSSPFKDYIKAFGSCCSIFALLTVLVLAQVACSGADYWITYWTQHEAIRNSNQTQIIENSKSDDWYQEAIVGNEKLHLIKTEIAMYVYAALIVAAIVLALMRSFGFFKMAMNASKKLHSQMFHSLLGAPMRFFDTNPSGRVLNRFSKDMGTIDEYLPNILINAFQIISFTVGILVMVIIANYYIVIVLVLLAALFLKIRFWYVATAKDIKHLEGISKSPVLSHLNSSLNGITTIRASRAEGVLSKEFDSHQDAHTAAWSMTIATRVCFGIWMDMISIIFIAIVVYSFIILDYYGQVSGSMVGLAISQSLLLTGMLQFGMKQTAEVVNQLTSVERVMQYTQLQNENEGVKKKITKPWPSRGFIEFRNLSLRYCLTDPAILHNLNILISPGNKVGIVGRTGAGKTSLISALFRLAPIEGSILIDNIDTKNIELNLLRKHISIIPQDPVLFSASLRYNLDPFDEFHDKQLWKVLEEVELKEKIESLDFNVSEGGSNFSLGQRQLLCLARAILRNNKILVLDEATANVDQRTDSLIQATIRRKFHDCTVLTIAHRLNTIMDSDKVLVMESGKMVEFDHPFLLLQDHNGYFFKMVSQTGPVMAQQLTKLAYDSYLTS